MAPLIRPLIGITSSISQNKTGSTLCEVGQAYVHAIRRAGGLPMVIPVGVNLAELDALIGRLDGVLFTGGGDIGPQYFEGQAHPKVYGVNSERDQLEFTLLKLALQADLPLLAICRGIQVLNVGLGGSLYTHIQDQLPKAIKHDWYPDYPRHKLAHPISIPNGSKLHTIFGAEEVPVNSLHHQGIARIGQGLKVTATAPDRLVEAVEVKDARFALGVQWHPECLPEAPAMQALFRAFIEACEE